MAIDVRALGPKLNPTALGRLRAFVAGDGVARGHLRAIQAQLVQPVLASADFSPEIQGLVRQLNIDAIRRASSLPTADPAGIDELGWVREFDEPVVATPAVDPAADLGLGGSLAPVAGDPVQELQEQNAALMERLGEVAATIAAQQQHWNAALTIFETLAGADLVAPLRAPGVELPALIDGLNAIARAVDEQVTAARRQAAASARTSFNAERAQLTERAIAAERDIASANQRAQVAEQAAGRAEAARTADLAAKVISDGRASEAEDALAAARAELAAATHNSIDKLTDQLQAMRTRAEQIKAEMAQATADWEAAKLEAKELGRRAGNYNREEVRVRTVEIPEKEKLRDDTAERGRQLSAAIRAAQDPNVTLGFDQSTVLTREEIKAINDIKAIISALASQGGDNSLQIEILKMQINNLLKRIFDEVVVVLGRQVETARDVEALKRYLSETQRNLEQANAELAQASQKAIDHYVRLKQLEDEKDQMWADLGRLGEERKTAQTTLTAQNHTIRLITNTLDEIPQVPQPQSPEISPEP